ncbi:MAG: prepilin-type N-terminal cleavage/methylation domain-containing protein [bacterium]
MAFSLNRSIAGKRSPQHGFTLIESLVALLILSVAYAGVTEAVSRFVDQRLMIDQRNISHRIAWNKLSERYLVHERAMRPDQSSSQDKEGKQTFSQIDWFWAFDTERTQAGGLTRTEVVVSIKEGGKLQPVRSLVIFLNE